MQTNNKSVDSYRVSSGLVRQRILGLIKLGVELEVVEPQMTLINTCNILKLVKLDGLPRSECSLSGWDEPVQTLCV